MDAQATFEILKDILLPFESSATLVKNNDTTYHLDYKDTDQSDKSEMFAAVMIKKNYVSMYFMPIYNNPGLLEGISSDLKKHMQGKSCFNFKNENDKSIEELRKFIVKTASLSL